MRSKNENMMNDILLYINDCFFSGSGVPSLQEIADKIGIAKSTTSNYITEMQKRGMLTKSGSHYGIETNAMKKSMHSLRSLPIVGRIACGTPILAEENIESYISISGEFLGTGDYFILKASGESMIKSGINDGDYVIIKKQSFAEEGQIVVAMVDGGDCTLKKYYVDKKRKKVRLHPENDSMEDMYFDNVEIQGVGVKVIKNLQI